MVEVSDTALIQRAVASAGLGLVDRGMVAEVVALCAVAGEHLLVVGPPGTAKSEAVRRVAAQLGGTYFEYLLGRFTEPNEIFGPVDLRRLREGIVEVETAGMLPEADVAFLDEVFLGSTAVLNTLLGILNERRFRRGRTDLQCPLRVCVGASNTLPEDPALAAFADRFLARLFVEPIADAHLEEMLEAGWKVGPGMVPHSPDTLAALDRLSAAAARCELSEVQPVIGVAVRRLRAAGLTISDRRAVRSQRLVAAAATLDGRATAARADLWVLPLIAPTADAQPLIQETLVDLLADSRSSALLQSAEMLSRGRAARADRLVETGRTLLAGSAGGATGDERLRLEATLREMDSAFGPEDRIGALGDTRTRLVDALAT